MEKEALPMLKNLEEKMKLEFDYEINWDDLPNNWKLIIYQKLIPPLLN